MSKFITMLLAAFLAFAPLGIQHAYAHGDHGAHFEKADAIDLASRYLVSIVESKTPIEGEVLDASWSKVPATDMDVVTEEAWYFVVSVHHAGQNKTLYMLISKKGRLYSANFSGKFEGMQ